MTERHRSDQGSVPRWREVAAAQAERLRDAHRAKSATESEVKKLAADVAMGREDIKRELRKKQAALRDLDTECQTAAAALEGAQQKLCEAEETQTQELRAAGWRHCRDLAKHRETLAADLERHLAAAAAAFRELDRLGLELHERAPRRAAWLGRGGVISGVGLLARVAAALQRAGLPGGGPEVAAQGATLEERERELHDAYLKQAYR